MSLKDARSGRDAARQQLQEGIDPSAHRRAAQAAITQKKGTTLEAVATEWWEQVHRHNVVAAHAGRNLRRLQLHLFPALGGRPIGEVTPQELLEALRAVESKGRGETAHRVRTLCSQVYRYAVRTGRADRDIAADLRDALRAVEDKHLAAIVDPKEIGPLLRAIDGYGGQPTTCAALSLTALLFVRPGELRHAEWKDFDLEAGVWNFTPSKGGAPLIIPLPRQAVEILRETESLTGAGRYVFPSLRGGNRPMSEAAVNAALHRMGYKDVMTAHGFRAMARTVLVEQLDYPIEHVEMQLGHSVRDPLGRAYNRTTYLKQRRTMLQEWADYLDKLKADGEQATSGRSPQIWEQVSSARPYSSPYFQIQTCPGRHDSFRGESTIPRPYAEPSAPNSLRITSISK